MLDCSSRLAVFYLLLIGLTSRALYGDASSLDTFYTGISEKSNPLVPPELDVTLEISLHLWQILDVDEKSQIISTEACLELMWDDPRLSWDNKTSPNGMKHISLPASKVWTPKPHLLNTADDPTSLVRHGNSNDVLIFPNGRVKWPIQTKFISSCTIDVTYYPFDQQTCILKFADSDPTTRVKIGESKPYIRLDSFYSSVDWAIIEVPAYLNMFPGDPYNEYDITYYLTIRRRTNCMYQVYPPIALAVLTLTSFFVSRQRILEKLVLHCLNLMGIFMIWRDTMAKLAATTLVTPHIFKFIFPLAIINLLHLVLTCILSNCKTSKQILDDNIWIKFFCLVFRRSTATATTRGFDQNDLESDNKQIQVMATDSKWLCIVHFLFSASVCVWVIYLVFFFLFDVPHVFDEIDEERIL